MTTVAMKLRRQHSFKKTISAASVEDAEETVHHVVRDASGEPVTTKSFVESRQTLTADQVVTGDSPYIMQREFLKTGVQHVSEYASEDGKHTLAVEHASVAERDAAPKEIAVTIG